jgi:excisionase family DNA binding protein
MTPLLDRLRKLAEAVPAGCAVIVPRDWLDAELHTSRECADRSDLTVAQVADLLNRPESTIRDWLASGCLNGGYKRGRTWRVPRTALGGPTLAAAGSDEQAQLGAWRRVRHSRPERR